MQLNRLERVWKFVKPELLRRWKKITVQDFANNEIQFDQIVEAIRKAHFPGRAHLTLEGEIRDWLCARMEFYERTNQTSTEK